MIEKLYTIAQTARRMKMSEHTIYNYCMSGRLNAFDYGTPKRSLWRISDKAIQAFLNGTEAKARAEQSRAMVGKKQPRTKDE